MTLCPRERLEQKVRDLSLLSNQRYRDLYKLANTCDLQAAKLLRQQGEIRAIERDREFLQVRVGELQAECQEASKMKSARKIIVWIQHFKDRRNLLLQWIDPETGKRRSKSAGTTDEHEAECQRAKLELALEAGYVPGEADQSKMPSAPRPRVGLLRTDKQSRRIAPWESGIYFLWHPHEDAVLYVGQSICLADRLRSNHNFFLGSAGARVSWLIFPREELNFAECYYIWKYRPRLNFGGIGEAFTKARMSAETANA